MKRILIIAGPNGAGKTTFATEFLPNEAGCPEFVNADLIAAGLSPFQSEKVAFTAGRLMLSRIDELAAAEASFAFETTLSTRSWAPRIGRWQSAGYRITLHFLKLPNPELAIERVRRRVQQGGHSIPEATIRRRFLRGLENLWERYLPLADEWFIYDASSDAPALLETGARPGTDKLMEDSPTYQAREAAESCRTPEENPELAGALAALARGAAKAIARDRAAGLEPVVYKPTEENKSRHSSSSG